jgi:hypothetical protein
MIKFVGYDEKGNAMHEACVTHLYADLPGKGFARSFEGVGIDEPVIILESQVVLNPIGWGYTQAEIERRAYELDADTNWMELPARNLSDYGRVQMWFSKKKQ